MLGLFSVSIRGIPPGRKRRTMAERAVSSGTGGPDASTIGGAPQEKSHCYKSWRQRFLAVFFSPHKKKGRRWPAGNADLTGKLPGPTKIPPRSEAVSQQAASAGISQSDRKTALRQSLVSQQREVLPIRRNESRQSPGQGDR